MAETKKRRLALAKRSASGPQELCGEPATELFARFPALVKLWTRVKLKWAKKILNAARDAWRLAV
jgi:hypothetical protein